MVQETVFSDRCHDFCRDVVKVNEAKVISEEYDYSTRTIKVVMLGETIDSIQISEMKAKMPQYGLGNAHLDLVQGARGLDEERVRGIIFTEKNKVTAAQKQLAENEQRLKVLRDSIKHYATTLEESKVLLPEIVTLFPNVSSVSTGRGVHTYLVDSVMMDSIVYVVNVNVDGKLRAGDEERMVSWLSARLRRKDLHITVVQNIK
jgi:hypothetical protein